MWYEYSIPANFELQKQIIRQLRKWIQDLEERELIRGFAFDHYSNNPQRGDVLCIRFDYPNEENAKWKIEKVKRELENEVRKLVPSYALIEKPWESPHLGELEAYEFGSRCAFLFWDLVEKGRLKEDYISDVLLRLEPNVLPQFHKVPLVFQQCFNHGVMNSLGVPKRPNEQMMHLISLMESTDTKNIKKLFQKIRIDPYLSQLRFPPTVAP